MSELRCLIMGAAGRDFHDFAMVFRDRPELRVVAFTAEQIPYIDQRTSPAVLAGPRYPDGIPIVPEAGLEALIRDEHIDLVFLAYSDLAHVDVMHKVARVHAAGASFAMLGPRQTMLKSRLPVIAVTAVRTGAGKSPISQAIVAHLSARGLRTGVLRHPMPYGDLARQAVQRFATLADLDQAACTIEEREEYTPYIERGVPVFAGVDYARILEAAEAESDVILWDGGNNDTPFVTPTVWIAVADGLRPGHEVAYHPGETNVRAADVVVLNKVSEAEPSALVAMRTRIAGLAPRATCIESDLVVTIDRAVAGKRVMVVEDGPTLTHGGMAYGAGVVAALEAGAELIDPRPFAVGAIAEAFTRYPHIGRALPALGYSEAQSADFAATILAAKPEVIVDASPAHASRNAGARLAHIPVAEVGYRFVQRRGPDLMALLDRELGRELGRAPGPRPG